MFIILLNDTFFRREKHLRNKIPFDDDNDASLWLLYSMCLLLLLLHIYNDYIMCNTFFGFYNIWSDFDHPHKEQKNYIDHMPSFVRFNF